VEIKHNNGVTQGLTTRSIVIAAGARPFVPPLPGLQGVGCVTSDTLWEKFGKLDAVPAPLVVSGGGPIGCELAQSFSRLGSRVTQVEVAPRLLLREDEELSELAREALTRDGVAVRTGHKALRCEREGERKFMVVEHQGGASCASSLMPCCAPSGAWRACRGMGWRRWASIRSAPSL
jgi:pyruvate/2-oxoglutarate dehydrogenase complex dihydrolipoamide dehydrogenase (E3) component